MTIDQMTDIYDAPIDVNLVRTFRNGRQMGGGYDILAPSTWFVYDRDGADERWHKHCGPYSTYEQAADWIRGIREEER